MGDILQNEAREIAEWLEEHRQILENVDGEHFQMVVNDMPEHLWNAFDFGINVLTHEHNWADGWVNHFDTVLDYFWERAQPPPRIPETAKGGVINRMNWLEACKEWNRRKGGKYEVPKKGTAGYNEVRKLMGKSPTKKAVVKGGFLPLLTAGLTALPAIISLFKGNGKRMEQSAQHLVDEMVGAGLIGGTHKSQYVKWLLGRVRGNREGEVKKPDDDDWGEADDVYRRPYPKDKKRKPVARDNPLDTDYAGWRPEDWEGKFPPFKPEDVKKRSKFIQALLPTEKARARSDDGDDEAPKDKKKYKLNPNLRKFPGITSKQMVDFRTRVGSKRSQNTFGELTNMGKFFGDEDFLNKYDTVVS